MATFFGRILNLRGKSCLLIFPLAGLLLVKGTWVMAHEREWEVLIEDDEQNRVYVGECLSLCRNGYDQRDELIVDVSQSGPIFIDHRNDPAWYGPEGVYRSDIRGEMTATGHEWLITLAPQGKDSIELRFAPMLMPHRYEVHLYDLDADKEVGLSKNNWPYADLSATITLSGVEKTLKLQIIDPKLLPESSDEEKEASLCFIPAVNDGLAVRNPDEVKNLECPTKTPVFQAIPGEDLYVDVLYDGSQVDGSVWGFQINFNWDDSLGFVECVLPHDDLLRAQGESINKLEPLIPTGDCLADEAFSGHDGKPPVCVARRSAANQPLFTLAHLSAEVENGRSWILSRCLIRTQVAPKESKFTWVKEDGSDPGYGTMALGDYGPNSSSIRNFIGGSKGRLVDAYFGSAPSCRVVYETISPNFRASYNPLMYCFDPSAGIRANLSWNLPDGCLTANGDSVPCSPAVNLFQDGAPILEDSFATNMVQTIRPSGGNGVVFRLEATDRSGICENSVIDEPIRVAVPEKCFDPETGWQAVSFPFRLYENKTNEALQDYLAGIFAFQFSEGRFKPMDSDSYFHPGAGYWILSPTGPPSGLDVKFTDPYSPEFENLGYGWNFLGNPYAANLPWGDNIAISCRQTVTLSEAVEMGWTDGVAYMYEEIAGIEKYRKADFIPPWGAFFLKSSQPSCMIEFNLQ